ncbi:MAG: RHS repeat-associated core domain-containing protein [Telluria sp.]|nr:RHS repeat-associated core domain-containing protein [Telluria sp.]
MAWRASGLSLLSTSDCSTVSVLAAKKTGFYYDGLNRLTTTTYGDGSASIFRTYTANGLPETIRSGAATWTYTYNKRRLIELERLDYGRAYTIARRYDGNGSLRQLQYPVDYLTLSLNPNALGEPRQIGAYASLITYHPNGALATFKYGNGITHTLTQNRRGLPEQSTDDHGVLSDRYTYDANANVAGIADLMPPNVTNRTMGYDGLDRLKTVSAPNLWGNASYEYDALDNLTSTTITGGGTARNSIHSYDASKNRLDSITGGPAQYNFAYGYDTQGNIIKRGAQEYVFDLGNRMKSATGKGSYVYDGLGRRVSAVGVDGVNRVQVYSQDGKLMYAGPTGSTGTKYIYLHNHLIAEVGGAGTQYDHTDGLGSPVAITNEVRGIVSRTRYEPYGATAQGATPALGFAGHVSAPDLGLVYMQQRYYDPIAGRMLSIDPVVADANTGSSFNRYKYAENNPYAFVDPDGRHAVAAVFTGGVILMVGAYKYATDPKARAVINRAIASAIGGGGKNDTLRPGPHAGESVPARGPDRDFTPGERDKINQIGGSSGCHTCGTTEAGTQSGNFIPDHQPPNAINPTDGPQELYPHCLTCSRTQGGQVRADQITNPKPPPQEPKKPEEPSKQ